MARVPGAPCTNYPVRVLVHHILAGQSGPRRERRHGSIDSDLMAADTTCMAFTPVEKVCEGSFLFE